MQGHAPSTVPIHFPVHGGAVSVTPGQWEEGDPQAWADSRWLGTVSPELIRNSHLRAGGRNFRGHRPVSEGRNPPPPIPGSWRLGAESAQGRGGGGPSGHVERRGDWQRSGGAGASSGGLGDMRVQTGVLVGCGGAEVGVGAGTGLRFPQWQMALWLSGVSTGKRVCAAGVPGCGGGWLCHRQTRLAGHESSEPLPLLLAGVRVNNNAYLTMKSPPEK